MAKSEDSTAAMGVSANLTGLGLGIFSGASFQAMNVCIRFLGGAIHPFEAAFFRYLIGLVLLGPLIWRAGARAFYTRRWGLHVLRAAFNIVSLFTAFLGVTMVPLTKFTALFFTAPLFATLGAITLLGEASHLRRWLALLAGFAGALVILRPGSVEIGFGEILALVAAASWAAAMLVIKSLARTDSALTINCLASAIQAPMGFIIALFVWRWPSWDQFGLLVAVALFATLAQMALAHAFRLAEATLVLSVDFLKLVWASLAGYFLFAELPDPLTWVGGLILFASATYIAVSERSARPARPVE